MPQLKLKDQGYYKGYSSFNEAGTFNAVAVSALQVFLSMLPLMPVSAVIHTYDLIPWSCYYLLTLSNPCPLWKPKIYNHLHKSPTPYILSQLN
jgi:hypothetical protein